MTEKHRFKVLKVIVQKDVTEQEYPTVEKYFRVRARKYYIRDRYDNKDYVIIKTTPSWKDTELCFVDPSGDELYINEPELKDLLLGFIIDWTEENRR